MARTWFGRGGYIPSILGGIMRVGPYFMTASIGQASRLLGNNKTRMASRGIQRTRTRRSKKTQK